MPKIRSWFELTSVGALYTLSIFILFINFHFYNETELKELYENWSSILLPILVVTSYLLGLLAEQVSTLLIPLFPEKIKKILRGKKLISSLTGTSRTRSIIIWQKGSEKLNQVVHENWQVLMLLRSLSLAFPTFSFSILFFLYSRNFINYLLISFPLFFLITIAIIISYRQQYKYYHQVMENAIKHLEKME